MFRIPCLVRKLQTCPHRLLSPYVSTPPHPTVPLSSKFPRHQDPNSFICCTRPPLSVFYIRPHKSHQHRCRHTDETDTLPSLLSFRRCCLSPNRRQTMLSHPPTLLLLGSGSTVSVIDRYGGCRENLPSVYDDTNHEKERYLLYHGWGIHDSKRSCLTIKQTC